MTNTSKKTAGLPNLSALQLFLITFGYAGVQVAFSLQTGSMGRIFQTIGADPNKLGFFFILPPLAGMIVQPLIGYFSDKTWLPRIGRRMPYLIGGTLVAVIVMLLLPNTGSFGFGYGSMTALWFGAVTVLFMDLSSNAAMQPYKMIIPDMVNESQKDKAWTWQNIWGSVGSIVAYMFPYILTLVGVANVAKRGSLPPSVIISFYIGAAILVVASIFTIVNVKEYNPKDFAAYHGLKEGQHNNDPISVILKKAPTVFWTLGLVEFFAWIAIQYMWTYSTGTLAQNIWHVSDPATHGYQEAGNWFGVLQALYAFVAILWGLVIQRINKKTRKPAFSLGMLCGGVGFIVLALGHTQLMSLLAFALIGIAWISLITIPFTILTNALDGQHDGMYLGLFNCFICIPQIFASVVSFSLFPALGESMPHMIMISGICFFICSILIWVVKETSAENQLSQF